jgi:CRP/FNR family cyclic AMP-dependent transcriptional regulator
MSLKESAEKLKDVSLFSGCSKRELQRIAKVGDETTVEAGRILMEQGDAGRQAFVILEGTAIVRRGGRKVSELGPGDTAGELALLDRGPRTAQVRAETDMRVLVLTASGLMGLLDETPNMAAKLLTSLASRVRELDRKIYG